MARPRCRLRLLSWVHSALGVVKLAGGAVRPGRRECAALSCAHNTSAGKDRGSRRSRNRGPSSILAHAQRRVGSRGFLMLALGRSGFDVPITCDRHLRRGGLGIDPVAAVVTHPVHGNVVDYGLVVDIGDIDVVDVVDGAVVVQAPTLPVAPFIAFAAVAVAVVHAAIESDVAAPITGVPAEKFAGNAPIAGRPQVLRLWRDHPRTRHPVIVLDVVTPGPIARGPYIALVWNGGLVIDRQLGGWHVHRHLYRNLRHTHCGEIQRNKCPQNQPTPSIGHNSCTRSAVFDARAPDDPL